MRRSSSAVLTKDELEVLLTTKIEADKKAADGDDGSSVVGRSTPLFALFGANRCCLGRLSLLNGMRLIALAEAIAIGMFTLSAFYLWCSDWRLFYTDELAEQQALATVGAGSLVCWSVVVNAMTWRGVSTRNYLWLVPHIAWQLAMMLGLLALTGAVGARMGRTEEGGAIPGWVGATLQVYLVVPALFELWALSVFGDGVLELAREPPAPLSPTDESISQRHSLSLSGEPLHQHTVVQRVKSAAYFSSAARHQSAVGL